MSRPKRLTAQAALQMLLEISDSENESEIEEEEELYEVGGDGDVEAEEVQEDREGADEDNGEIEIVSEHSSSDESDGEDPMPVRNYDFTNALGVNYKKEPFPSRRRQRNIVHGSRSLAHPRDEQEAFLLFISEGMIREILRHTNRKASDIRRFAPNIRGFMNNFSYEEICACLGLLLRAGVDRDNMSHIEDLWNPTEGRPIFRAVMSSKRFCFFLRCLRLDNFRDRPARLANDRLAAVRSIWEQFLSNLRRHYEPHETLTVDEQLVGYRGSIPGRTYIPSKPAKYGLKVFWLAEARSGYALNAKIYSGKDRDAPPHRNLGMDIVMELTAPYFNTGRDIVTDNYFTSHQLAVSLLQQGLTLLGTIRSQRKEVPTQMKSKQRPVETTIFAHDHDNKIVLVSYIPKRNKNVLLLSSSHSGEETVQNNKPALILDYNQGKGGVDQLDQNVDEFTCRRKTVRWPLIVFYNILDVAAFNGFLLMKKDHPRTNRKDFLRNLAYQLVQKHAKARHSLNKHLSQHIISAGVLLAFRPPNQCSLRRQIENSVQHCHMCYKNTRSKCEVCSKPVCPTHRVVVKSCKCQSC